MPVADKDARTIGTHACAVHVTRASLCPSCENIVSARDACPMCGCRHLINLADILSGRDEPQCQFPWQQQECPA